MYFLHRKEAGLRHLGCHLCTGLGRGRRVGGASDVVRTKMLTCSSELYWHPLLRLQRCLFQCIGAEK
ncbi:hypothetical protein GDO81_001422 [Engystomops pustulosus]|uniref:Uncharacterized protein n=1 Tax=Engystomops pustulosus TaxID=76066 RepID=A0AAV7DDM8_ENGPU|nr:hypothetical protein GDO81_001422 [Engystomops pustulosus]